MVLMENKYSWAEICETIIQKAEVKPELQKEFTKWFLSKEYLGYLFNDPLLWKHCFHIQRKMLKDNGDHFTLVCGKERSGKSTLLSQICAVISPNYCLKHCCFKFIDFVNELRTAEKGTSFQLDEGALFLFSAEAQSVENRSSRKLFTIMGAKNLHVGIAIPNFWLVDNYVRNHRVDTLVYVSSRGEYTIYRDKAIKIIAKEGERLKTIAGIRVPYGTFWQGKFRKDMPTINDFSPESYSKYKLMNVNRFIDELSELAQQIDKEQYCTVAEVKKMLGLDARTVIKMLKEGKLTGINTGGKWLIQRECLIKPPINDGAVK